jgi:hypothetical protein
LRVGVHSCCSSLAGRERARGSWHQALTWAQVAAADTSSRKSLTNDALFAPSLSWT